MVRINNLMWTIDEVGDGDTLYRNRQSGNGEVESVVGKCDPVTTTIYLHEALSGDMFEVVLRHELTHAYLTSYGFDSFESFEVEQICDFCGTYAGMIDSDVRDYIAKRDECEGDDG